jgi:hypothetical protein
MKRLLVWFGSTRFRWWLNVLRWKLSVLMLALRRVKHVESTF